VVLEPAKISVIMDRTAWDRLVRAGLAGLAGWPECRPGGMGGTGAGAFLEPGRKLHNR